VWIKKRLPVFVTFLAPGSWVENLSCCKYISEGLCSKEAPGSSWWVVIRKFVYFRLVLGGSQSKILAIWGQIFAKFGKINENRASGPNLRRRALIIMWWYVSHNRRRNADNSLS